MCGKKKKKRPCLSYPKGFLVVWKVVTLMPRSHCWFVLVWFFSFFFSVQPYPQCWPHAFGNLQGWKKRNKTFPNSFPFILSRVCPFKFVFPSFDWLFSTLIFLFESWVVGNWTCLLSQYILHGHFVRYADAKLPNKVANFISNKVFFFLLHSQKTDWQIDPSHKCIFKGTIVLG